VLIPDTAESHILFNDPAFVFTVDNPCLKLRLFRISSKAMSAHHLGFFAPCEIAYLYK
jgi:hypothetical protein